jgi:hypothetical protein
MACSGIPLAFNMMNEGMPYGIAIGDEFKGADPLAMPLRGFARHQKTNPGTPRIDPAAFRGDKVTYTRPGHIAPAQLPGEKAMGDYLKDVATFLGTARDALRRAKEVEPAAGSTHVNTNRIRSHLRHADNVLGRAQTELAAPPAPREKKQKEKQASAPLPSQAVESTAKETGYNAPQAPAKFSS